MSECPAALLHIAHPSSAAALRCLLRRSDHSKQDETTTGAQRTIATSLIAPTPPTFHHHHHRWRSPTTIRPMFLNLLLILLMESGPPLLCRHAMMVHASGRVEVRIERLVLRKIPTECFPPSPPTELEPYSQQPSKQPPTSHRACPIHFHFCVTLAGAFHMAEGGPQCLIMEKNFTLPMLVEQEEEKGKNSRHNGDELDGPRPVASRYSWPTRPQPLYRLLPLGDREGTQTQLQVVNFSSTAAITEQELLIRLEVRSGEGSGDGSETIDQQLLLLHSAHQGSLAPRWPTVNSPANFTATRTLLTSLYGNELVFQLVVSCQPGFYGRGCATYCRTANRKQEEKIHTAHQVPTSGNGNSRQLHHYAAKPHYTCTESGMKCDAGWEGDRCSQPICTPQCSNGGACIAPGQCICRAGWEGSRCSEKCHCQPHGYCRLDGQCVCHPNWRGVNCSEMVLLVDACKQTPTLCKNGGTCTPIALPATSGGGGYLCRCPPGYWGENCELSSRSLAPSSSINSKLSDAISPPLHRQPAPPLVLTHDNGTNPSLLLGSAFNTRAEDASHFSPFGAPLAFVAIMLTTVVTALLLVLLLQLVSTLLTRSAAIRQGATAASVPTSAVAGSARQKGDQEAHSQRDCCGRGGQHCFAVESKQEKCLLVRNIPCCPHSLLCEGHRNYPKTSAAAAAEERSQCCEEGCGKDNNSSPNGQPLPPHLLHLQVTSTTYHVALVEEPPPAYSPNAAADTDTESAFNMRRSNL